MHREAHEEIPSGTVISGKYRVIGALGAGGMAQVFEAVHVGLETPLALKVLDAHYAKMPEMVARFDREAKAAANIQSPHVAKVLDVGELPDGRPFLAMELLVGEDVALTLGRGPLRVDDAVDFVLQAARGLEAAHAIGIVHRDIKPENLFACDLGPLAQGRRLIKIVDFGIAKDTREYASRMTAPGYAMGSVRYMAPEQIRSAEAVDARTDVWALGVVMYELLVGATPFDGDSHAIIASVMTDPAPRLRLARPEVPEALELVYQRLLAKDPAARFQSMSDLIAALEPFVPREPAAALAARIPPHTLPRRVPSPAMSSSGRLRGTDAGWSTQPARSARGSRVLWVAFGLMLLAGVVLATVALRQRSAAPSSVSDAPPRASSGLAMPEPLPVTTESASAPTPTTASTPTPPTIASIAPSATASVRGGARPPPRNPPATPATGGLPRRF